MNPTHPTSAPRAPSFPELLGILAAMAAMAVTTPAHAQLGFTEFALTDTSLNSSPSTDFWIASAAPADIDGDGDLDLLIAGYYVIYPTEENPDGWVDHRLTLYRNDGPAGAEWALVPVDVEAEGVALTSADLAWGDYDADGDPDVAVGASGQLLIYRNDGGTLVRTGTELPAYVEDSDFTTMDLHSLTWADVDNDGDLDLLVPSAVSDFDRLPVMTLRNDGPGTAGAWTFTDAGAALPIAANAVSAWADMEGDGDLDLLLGNISPYGDNFLETWRNDAGTLVRADIDLAFIRYGTADWGDADDDGNLDVVYGGNIDLVDAGETVVRILYGDGSGGYTPVDVARDFGGAEPWLDFSAVSWADYDSDGDVDLLVCGLWLLPGEIEGRAMVYVNQGGRSFAAASQPLPAPIAGIAGGAFTWFDVDGDGDLDYFVAGGYYVPDGQGLIEARTQLFRNDAIATNAAPGMPGGPAAEVSGLDARLSWTAASDDRTPQAALTYQLEVVGPSGGGWASSSRPLPQPGNVSGNLSWMLKGLEPGTYAWSVRALDHAFNGGPTAAGAFTILSTTGVGAGAAPGLALSAPRPNPMGSEAHFTLTLDRPGSVEVAAYDVRGRRVAVIHDGPLDAGVHVLGMPGRALSNGTYFVHATAHGRTAVRRVTLLR